jgi:hypothetical protein
MTATVLMRSFRRATHSFSPDKMQKMSILKLFKRKKIEHAVLVYFNYGFQDLNPLHDVENDMEELLLSMDVGSLDGHDIAVDANDGILYLYGSDAKKLYNAIKPILLKTSWMAGARIHLRFGDVDDQHAKTIDLRLE